MAVTQKQEVLTLSERDDAVLSERLLVRVVSLKSQANAVVLIYLD